MGKYYFIVNLIESSFSFFDEEIYSDLESAEHSLYEYQESFNGEHLHIVELSKLSELIEKDYNENKKTLENIYKEINRGAADV